jgi:hypothetical protein
LAARLACTGADLKTLRDFPYRHCRRDLLWVPPLRLDVAILIFRTSNPFFERAEAECFTALRAGGTPVGRIAAIRNHAHERAHPEDVGRIRNDLERMGLRVNTTYRMYDRAV